MEKPWKGEFPLDSASDMDAAAVKILLRNMRAGSAAVPTRYCVECDGRLVRGPECVRVPASEYCHCRADDELDDDEQGDDND